MTSEDNPQDSLVASQNVSYSARVSYSSCEQKTCHFFISSVGKILQYPSNNVIKLIIIHSLIPSPDTDLIHILTSAFPLFACWPREVWRSQAQKNVFLLEIQPILVELHIWVYHDYQWKAFLQHVQKKLGYESSSNLGLAVCNLQCRYQSIKPCNSIIETLHAEEYRIMTVRVKIWWIKLL